MCELQHLILRSTKISNLWILRGLSKLYTLEVRESMLPNFHELVVNGIESVRALVNLYNPQQCFLQSKSFNVVNLPLVSNYVSIKLLHFAYSQVHCITLVSKFVNLEAIDLSGVRVRKKKKNHSKLANISFLSSCTKLKSVALNSIDVVDLSPVSYLPDLTHLHVSRTRVCELTPLRALSKLSILDVRETKLPKEHYRLVTGREEVTSFLLNLEEDKDTIM
ncbi:hypothetical protein RCL1_003383 [Eukaryota sp. TZLM3-RCL]